MKKLHNLAIIPVLSLLVAGCSSPMALQTSEYDDMYYTSSDRTEYAQPGVASNSQNQQYADASGTEDYQGDEYYDGRTYNAETYDTRNNWYQPSYSFVDPYWGTAYGTAFYPRYSSFRYGSAFYDPFFDPFYDPFYDPFFSPWGPRGFNRFSVSIGYGMGWGGYGMGGMGYGMGYGMGGFHRPYGMMGPYGGFYNGFNSGFYQGYYAGSLIDGPGQVRRVQYGPRNERSTQGAVQGATGRPARENLSATGQQRLSSSPGAQNARPSVTPTRTTRSRATVQPDGNNQQRDVQSAPSRQPQRVVRQQQPEQQQQRTVRQQQVQEQRSQPSYERSTPSYERSAPTQSAPSRPSNSGGGGRPSRGGF